MGNRRERQPKTDNQRLVFILQLLTMMGCGIVAVQDFKDREVIWICFPIIGVLLACLHAHRLGFDHFVFFALNNIVLVSCVLALLWTITKFVFKKEFLNVSFGLGDMLFIYAFALGFPTVTFIILFVGSILFSLLAFIILKMFTQAKTVPLAGFMGIFLISVLLLAFLPNTPSLYSI
ncbi:hypothetical protein HME9304_02750 [Flagellimonas maritima]|uniref:Prepilin type IV endopeptidase peptidase domain-containing protein n=1 Tax=Flagellimonas maritima TaxID=1383885 RepID=A0A2Z4LVF7_9FLAO|nr:hypothetical protein [Allomuricauda aurantiaca]AWX45723.1 hypothetical protein HME9304_02750 [Allomuricauda aurantiaca]